MVDENINQIDSFDTNTILDVKDLDKSFGDVHAVNNIFINHSLISLKKV